MYDLLRKRVLVTRGSARSIETKLAAALAEGNGEIALDFTGVDGITPSFLDETLTIIEESAKQRTQGPVRVTVEHLPTQFSSKFAAVGRAHGLDIQVRERGLGHLQGN